MIVVDTELSGLDPERDSIVSIGAIDSRDKNRTFYGECRVWDGAHISDASLEINGFTHADVTDSRKKTEAELIRDFLAWVAVSEDHTIAGQNVWTDYLFLREAAKRAHLNFPLARRIVDIHSIAVAHAIQMGKQIPLEKGRSSFNSEHISRYCGIPEEPKPHNALNGAKYEAEQLHRLLYNKPFLDEFAQFSIPWLGDKK